MRFHSVKLINYKSIGDKDLSEIIIEPRITAVIGRNESGKSNVLSGLSHINLIGDMSSAFAIDNINRNDYTGSARIKYEVVLKSTPDELKYDELQEDTYITITNETYEATGGILDYYLQYIHPCIKNLCNILESYSLVLRDQTKSEFNNCVATLKKTSSLNIKKVNQAIHFIEQHKKLFLDDKSDSEKNETENLIQSVRTQWNILLHMLPSVFYRNSDKVLKTHYRLDDIKKEFESPESYKNSLLNNFVKLINISKENFLLAVENGISGPKTSLRDKIRDNIETYINKPFSKFYTVEEIKLSVEFNSNSASFTAKSAKGGNLLLSERSDGLKWYLNTFIDSKANEVADSNVLYLLDEPGISLHVNAQKELLKLFNHLADSGNQIVYTTHSPYMLDTENDGLYRIRAVVKDDEGNTSIYKTPYDSRIAPLSQKDTLTPIINALGMNLNDTFGPSKDKINIVTEGMSDYIYICIMAKLLDVDMEKYAIIPSVGASNCVNICCILQGWGCHYIALFDYDKEGVEKGGEFLRKNMMLTYKSQYFYLADVSESDIVNKTYKESRYVIEDLVTEEEIKRFHEQNNTDTELGKTLTAKLLSDAIESGKFIISESVKNNFKELFKRLSIIY